MGSKFCVIVANDHCIFSKFLLRFPSIQEQWKTKLVWLLFSDITQRFQKFFTYSVWGLSFYQKINCVNIGVAAKLSYPFAGGKLVKLKK